MEGRGGRHGEEPTHEQLFQCLICLDRAQDAQLLRCCVKIVCRECVHRWLQNRRQCPHCREPLTQAQLTNWCETRPYGAKLFASICAAWLR